MAVIEGALSGAFPSKNPSAQVFNVDPSISGSLQVAIDACVAGNGDIILVERGGHTVTETVNFNKSGIQVFAVDDGLSPLARGEFNGILADASFTDGPVVTITAPCRLDGFAFVSRDTSTANAYEGAAALIGGAADGAFGVHIRNCRFPKWALDNRFGLALAGGAAVADVLVEDCTFEGVGADFDAGIFAQGAIQNLTIRRNHFRQCTAAVKFGVFAGGGPHVFIHENMVEDGLLLDTDGNAGNGLIAGNWLETATDTSSYDRSVATLQGDGYSFSGNHYSE